MDPATHQTEEEAPNHEYELEDLDLGGHFQCEAPKAASKTSKGERSLTEVVIRLCRYVRRKYENRAALRFLAELYRKRPVLDEATQTRKPLDKGILMEAFVGYMKLLGKVGREEAIKIYQEELDHKRYNEAIANANRYVREKGFRTFPLLLLNGLVLQGNMVERGLMQGLHMEQQAAATKTPF